MQPKRISILGSTGSIGRQTLEVVSAFPDRFKIIGLTAGQNLRLLQEQILKFQPLLVAVQEEKNVPQIQAFVQQHALKTRVFSGLNGLNIVATAAENQLLVVAIVGSAALLPTYKAIEKKIAIALACKEVLVTAGEIIMNLARANKVSIIPIDSEHAAIKQCLASVTENPALVNKLILTASGGPFWRKPQKEFAAITLEDALKHPNWTMGAKISIDSATLMNKGLEVIEAHHLFNIPYAQIDVVIHPQSIIHSMVEFKDGNILAQMNLPDMRFPIQYALSYPEKMVSPWPRTDLTKLRPLCFYKPNLKKFPLLKKAYDAGMAGGTQPTVLNAANEKAVHLFLQRKIDFKDISRLVEEALTSFSHFAHPDLNQILLIDAKSKATS